MVNWTTIRISKKLKRKIKEEGKGSSINEKLKFLLDMDSLSKTFVTEEEVKKICNEIIENYASY